MIGRSRRYLVEEPKREREAVRILLDLRWILGRMLGPLGLHAGFSWFMLGIGKNRLCDFAEGDVDILAGKLEWAEPNEFEAVLASELKGKADWHPSNVEFLAALKCAASGGIKWPPSTSWLVAIEAKCAYLHPQADRIALESFKSTKASPQKVRHVQAQVQNLMDMGFDRVALLDIIANPPVSGADGQAWLVAADLADQSMRTFSATLKRRLSLESAAGHYVWSIGAVTGGDEGRRGAGSPTEFRPARDNPFLSNPEVRARREQVEQRLREVFMRLPRPLNLRVIASECELCRQVHFESTACT